ncbi:hypothetical protein [Streptacidiphilus melanogenes]|uniref:hypothetical protein n=1 Tax=Streptacidiphilus melanogenes TaxID=411235 RepID=UPI0005A6E2EF|nr:hypothetical protein [Streptacidiphilus melanogenes]
MAEVESIPVAGRPARSLVWDGEELVDPVGGGRRWGPDGTERKTSVHWGYPFDRAAVSPSGRYAVIYVERGTKGIVVDLSGPRVLREINRSYYHSAAYDYPVALGRLSDGREVLVHCPDEYNRLEVEELTTGQRLTEGARRPEDVFQSRLEVSPGGRYLLVAGWIWHPIGVAHVHDLTAALTDPEALDDVTLLQAAHIDAEVASACWLDENRLVVAAADESLEWTEPPGLSAGQLGVWSMADQCWEHRSTVDFSLGTLLGRGSQVVSLHGHPRLIDLATGAVVGEWPEVKVPKKEGSYGRRDTPTPVAAISPDGTRLAVAQEDGIALIELPDDAGLGTRRVP